MNVFNDSASAAAAREARNAYLRAWRRANPERVRAINERYWMKKARAALEAERLSEEQDGKDE